jgi:hypothetical protein
VPAQRYHLYVTWADGIKIVGRPTEHLKEAQRAADEALDRDGAGQVVVLGDDGLPHYKRMREDGCPPRRSPDLRLRVSGLAE